MPVGFAGPLGRTCKKPAGGGDTGPAIISLMRREWSGIIKNRQWSEFEKLAKTEPSQGLADTVSELERGLDEKSDRRALRKVLYILSQAGYEPQDVDETAPAEVSPAKPFEMGFMASADGSGATGFAYGVEKQGRVRCIIAFVNQTAGVVDALERALSLEEAADFERRYFSDLGPGVVTAAVPPEYALSRIAAGLRRQKQRVPQAVAYWRETLAGAEDLPHPTESMFPGESTAEQRTAVSLMVEAALMWRLELGSVMPVLQELYESEKSGVQLTDQQRKERNESIFVKARAELFTADAVADHALRLRDLAYLSYLQGLPDVGLLLAAAVDLEAKGSESDYAKGLLEKTVALLLESWKQQSSRKGPAMRRFDQR